MATKRVTTSLRRFDLLAAAWRRTAGYNGNHGLVYVQLAGELETAIERERGNLPKRRRK